ncbi:hypothetical protein BGZ82_008221 [Podila clonocystis]|nr:hypothetical protein BGZ82_008221 [Podila clonocystis]
MEPAPSSTTPQPVPPSGSPAPNAAPLGVALTNVAGTAATAEPLQMEEVVSTNAVTAEAIARQNQTVVEEFQYLLEKSQQLFAGLRFVLENSYGLKRWEVGEIASKIGQLYYHYYLRTSDSGYLQDSYIFYEAIRERRYFNEISEIKSSALMIKKLRYYARFTVVCLLLNNRDIMASLKEELTDLVNEYITVYRPPDASDWQLVLQEVTSFTNIKFSELTIDMFRILQSLERETPQIRGTSVDAGVKASLTSAVSAAVASGTEANSTPAVKEETMDDPLSGQRRNDKEKKKPNPHKYLLYRPTLSQLMVYMATAFKEVASDSALLIYLSADGSKRPVQDGSGAKGYHGGILTNSRKDNSDPEQQSLSHCLHPGDLLPFTRKPMFLIVDSNNSVAFAEMPRVFNHPFMSLLSPAEYPVSIPDTTQVGGLFTLFLHAPLLAFSFISGISQISPDTWEQCAGLISQAEGKIAELMASAPLDKPLRRFLQDEFLRQFMIRFALCHIILKAHVSFTEPKHLPMSYPSLPASVLESTEVLSKIRALAILANATCFEFEEPIVVS